MKKVFVAIIFLIFFLYFLSYQVGKGEGMRQEREKKEIIFLMEKDTIIIICNQNQ